MNDDWLDKIRDTMSDLELDEPEGLWAAIEGKRRDGAVAPRRSRRKALFAWVGRTAAIVAVMAAIYAVIYSLAGKAVLNEEQRLSETQTPEQRPHAAGVLYIAEAPSDIFVVKGSADSPGCRPGPVQHGDSAGVIAVNHGSPSKDSSVAAASDNSADTVKQMRNHVTMPVMGSGGHIASLAPVSTGRGKISFSMFASGGTGYSACGRSMGDVSVAGMGPGNSEWADDPLLGILLFNQGRETGTEITHRLPVRVGMSLRYDFNDRLGLESGISYTNLASDIKEGSERHYMAGEQNLHYIGVPLNVIYRILSWSRLDLYASGGVLVEKCVSAKLEKEYILDRQKRGSVKEDLHDKPVQWSVNASVGLQFNISKSVGLYAEPGMAYYFNDGSPIKTIYKEKPFNFNVNFGIRFTIPSRRGASPRY